MYIEIGLLINKSFIQELYPNPCCKIVNFEIYVIEIFVTLYKQLEIQRDINSNWKFHGTLQTCL